MTLRPVVAADTGRLLALLADPTVARWWGGNDAGDVAELIASGLLLAIEPAAAPGTLAGGIQWHEEDDPRYRHAGIDLFLGAEWQGRGLGTDALRTVCRWLIRERGHHRLVIDPALANDRAIRAYARVGFRPVGVMREYEQGPDGTWHDGLLMDLLASELREDDAPG